MNVIIICSDTFRYDHLGFLKKQEVHTPNLDKLATEAAAFTEFYLCSFPTLVNRIEVFTGRYTFPFFNWGALPHQYPVLAEVFKRNGFTTALIADNLHMMRKGWGFGRGFDYIKDVPGQMHDDFLPNSAPMLELPCPAEELGVPKRRIDRYRRNARWYRDRNTTTTAEVFGDAIKWLDQAPAKFFMWIDAFDPHEPWDAPESFLQSYPWSKQGRHIIWPKSGHANVYPEADVANMRSLYRAEVSQVDHWVGKLIAQLQSQKLLDDTAVIFTSDHGTYFGEHGLLGKPVKIGKLTAIYEELGHLPLIVRHPEGLGDGQLIPGIGQPPDLYATALDLAGIQSVPWAQGNSLVPRLRGEPSPQNFAVSGYFPHKGRTSCVSLWTGEWALMHSPSDGLKNVELYHIPTDPQQTRNVAGSHPDVVGDLANTMGGWFDKLGVPPARKAQVLENAPFTWRDKLRYKFWLWQQRRRYKKQFARYATGENQNVSAALTNDISEKEVVGSK